jgi:hypothetical protein
MLRVLTSEIERAQSIQSECNELKILLGSRDLRYLDIRGSRDRWSGVLTCDTFKSLLKVGASTRAMEGAPSGLYDCPLRRLHNNSNSLSWEV